MSLWIVFGLIVIIALFVAGFFLKPVRGVRYRYTRKEYIMTKAEHKCFNALVEAVGDRYYVFPQMHLSHILYHKIGGQNWYGAFRHIDEKSVDFVLCDKDKLSPRLAIELDDWSHDRTDRQERDREVERILKEVGMPLLRLKDHSLFDDKLGFSKLVEDHMAAEVGV